jgi:hypothetical protein
MPTVRLYPGTVATYEPDARPAVTIVGDPATAWSDGSDATYAEAESFLTGLDASPIGVISLTSVPASAVISGVSVGYRVSMTATVSTFGYKVAQEWRTSTTDPDEVRFTDTLAGDPPAAQDVVTTLDAEGVAFWVGEYRPLNQMAINFFAINSQFPNPDWHSTARIYGVWLDVTYTTVGKAPICRGYPRHGAGGNSSPRAYPPSKARQGSPRATGYY